MVWESRTATAHTKCPSSDRARAWVAKTENGSLLTTSKVFPAISVPSVKFRVEGQPVDVDAPPARLREKAKVKKVGVVGGSNPPKHPADVLAKDLLENGCERAGSPKRWQSDSWQQSPCVQLLEWCVHVQWDVWGKV